MRHITPASPVHGRTARCGFTLVEILIVVIILGILASIVVPQFASVSSQSRENTLKGDLRFLRSQIQLYTAQHRDTFPDGATFVDQMTMYTNESGATNATETAEYEFGPYLSKMPVNPVNGKDTILVVATDAELIADDTTGWIYSTESASIMANNSGTDSQGEALADY